MLVRKVGRGLLRKPCFVFRSCKRRPSSTKDSQPRQTVRSTRELFRQRRRALTIRRIHNRPAGRPQLGQTWAGKMPTDMQLLRKVGAHTQPRIALPRPPAASSPVLHAICCKAGVADSCLAVRPRTWTPLGLVNLFVSSLATQGHESAKAPLASFSASDCC